MGFQCMCTSCKILPNVKPTAVHCTAEIISSVLVILNKSDYRSFRSH